MEWGFNEERVMKITLLMNSVSKKIYKDLILIRMTFFSILDSLVKIFSFKNLTLFDIQQDICNLENPLYTTFFI